MELPKNLFETVCAFLNRNGKNILHIYIHESSMVHKTKEIVFDRNEYGDYKVTIPERVANIYARKQIFLVIKVLLIFVEKFQVKRQGTNPAFMYIKAKFIPLPIL